MKSSIFSSDAEHSVYGDDPDMPSGVVHGLLDTYPPNGYIRDVFAAKDYKPVINSLRNGSWIDTSTAALVVKFALRVTNQKIRAGAQTWARPLEVQSSR